jgi:hypothetical protein
MAWRLQSWSHGLMMAVAGGGGSGCVALCCGGCVMWRDSRSCMA